MLKQAARKSRELVDNLNDMERDRPEEMLEHVANFSEEFPSFD